MIRPGHTRAISACLLTTAPRASISAISTSKVRPTVGEHLAAVWQHLEATECQPQRWLGSEVHRMRL
jgi:hypothetical protein